jgi:hypothetical protein
MLVEHILQCVGFVDIERLSRPANETSAFGADFNLMVDEQQSSIIIQTSVLMRNFTFFVSMLHDVDRPYF